MTIQLDKILQDIAKEKALHPNNGGASKQEQEEAWARIGRLNKLSVHESRSIFIVLQKKYEQEKLKGNSAWKLFGLMHQIHQESRPSIKEEDDQGPLDEVEEYEMLEVQEPEEDDDVHHDGQPANSTGSASSDGESPTKSHSTGSPEKDERVYSRPNVDTPRPAFEEKKLLNTLANNTPRSTTSNSLSAAAAVLQKKGITVKKAPGSSAGTAPKSTSGQQPPASGLRSASSRTTIQLPESLKRKLSEEYTASPGHKKLLKTTSPKQTAAAAATTPASSNIPEVQPSAGVVHTTTAQLMQVKKEREDNQTPPPGINIITIPPTQQINGGIGGGPTSSTAATIASTSVASTNGFSPHIEELDFKNDIIFDSKINAASSNTPEIINLGNFDNSLPPTFFKNLCNSSRHESLGLYVANVMNRLSSRASAKLELAILRAILDVQCDELEK
ncbi:uncharacterized protein LOC108090754 [Drosophila ficusphila]|uniref:uncharacterized protein LOC108090754 n=1 Tax=Drosophila ficusphila TaxID=30025 RepID=UPI0007E7F7A2|nr:uncharacterized protein LOC108090754 [Drosophila ficusphila]